MTSSESPTGGSVQKVHMIEAPLPPEAAPNSPGSSDRARTPEQRERSERRAERGAELLRAVPDAPFDHVRQDGDVLKIFFDAAESDHATLNVIDMPVDRVDDPERLVREFLAQHAPEMLGQRAARPFRPRGGFRGGRRG